MRQRIIFICLVFLLSSFVFAQSGNKAKDNKTQKNPSTQNSEQEETLKIDSTLVTIPVSVVDTDGKYLLSLKQKDFRLFEENEEQEITNFSSIEVPISIVLVIDTSRSTKFRIEDIQHAAVSFVEQLRPNDRVMIVSFDEKIRVQSEFTNDRNVLKQAIAKTKTGLGTKLYEAVNFVTGEKFKNVQGRKAIVLFTDGVDTESKNGSGRQSMFDAEKNEISIFSLQYDTMADVDAMLNGKNQAQKLLTSNPTEEEFALATRYLRGLAYRSGGRVHQAENLTNVNEAFAAIAEELRHQYSLGYYPKNEGKPGEFRRVRVEVLAPHQSIRARDGYRVGL